MTAPLEAPRPAASWLPMQFLVSIAALWFLPPLVWRAAVDLGLRPDGEVARALLDIVAIAVPAAAVLTFALLTPAPVPWRPLRLPRVVAIYLPFAALWLLLTVGYLRLLEVAGQPVLIQPALESVRHMGLSDPPLWPLLLGIVVGAPFLEELVFRGYLLGMMQQALPRHWANAVTALLFGAVHVGYGWGYLLPLAALGFLFGWLRQRHGALMPAVLAHMLHNGLTLTVALIAPGVLDWIYGR